jgi:methylmalonyl-CoA/ethylmalonyl-CoA epimerase
VALGFREVTTVKVDHIGIAVRDIQEVLKVYQEALGLQLEEIVEVQEQKVKVAFLPAGETNLELVQPTADDTGVAKFLETRGEGIHHICLKVDDIEAALGRLKTHGVPLIDRSPRQGAHGRIAFVHPKGMHGVLLELVERHPETAAVSHDRLGGNHV